ncbi:diguanylate cyclase [Alteromonas sp. H39]|uniref:GGDEF domain-containing protein n=1 Tax=Alteromonas sp. H39 TaxID=3389876 RepID=UPI0039DFF6F7
MSSSEVELVTIIAFIAGLAACTWALMAHPLQLYRSASLRFSVTNILLVIALLLSSWRADSTSVSLWLLTDMAFLAALITYKFAIAQLFKTSYQPRLTAAAMIIALITLLASFFVNADALYFSAIIYALAAVSLFSTAKIKYEALFEEFSPVIARLFCIPDTVLSGLLYVKVLSFTFIPHVVADYLFTEQYSSEPFLWAYLCLVLLLNITAMATTITRLILKMKFLAHRDQLTGLLNRRAMQLTINDLWAAHIKEQKEFCVLMVDIDYFKNVNDKYGHHTGDIAIRHIATQLCESTRETDACGRFGGEEFLIALPDTGLDEGRRVAEKLLTACSQVPWSEGKEQLTVSVGAAAACQAASCDKLVTLADRALYRAKSSGRNCAIAYGEHIDYSLASSSSS